MSKHSKIQSLLYPRIRAKRYIVDPAAFVLAMVGGPLLVTLFTFWMLGIPVAALILGGPLYLIVGAPVLLWHLARHAPNVDRISFLALISFGALAVAFALVTGLAGRIEMFVMALWFGLFGCVFAPLWGEMTGRIYIRLRREFFVHPVHV